MKPGTTGCGKRAHASDGEDAEAGNDGRELLLGAGHSGGVRVGVQDARSGDPRRPGRGLTKEERESGDYAFNVSSERLTK